MSVIQNLPAEWHSQSAVLLAWPHARSDWDSSLDAIEAVYRDLAHAISARQTLLVVAYDADHERHVRAQLSAAHAHRERCRIFIAPTNDTWVRDSAPLTVLRDDTPVLLDFVFNGWGNKYACEHDNALSPRLYRQHAFGETPIEAHDLVLEGGSVEVDGEGTLLSTTACLLATTRNPTLTREQIEQRLGDTLGIRSVLWLEHGYLAGDDTDSHVDMLARFCDACTIAYVRCDDANDEHYDALSKMERELQGFRRSNGEPYRLLALPWPAAKFNAEGERLPASYANFLILNDAVLVPTYDDPADAVALDVIAGVFPTREIIAIPSVALIAQRGGIHCATMQFPAGVVT